MSLIPLFTSIPARVSRRVHGDQEIGPAWTQACIASWAQAGYRVVSVNAAAEAAAVRSQFANVEVIEVARDGSALTGKPMVYLADMLALMAACGERTVAVANADVACMPAAAEALRGWAPDGFAYSNRLDIDDPAGANPQMHGGVDFLIVETRHLQGLAVPPFLFGTPWWDYWLPMALMGRGAAGRRLSVKGLPVIAHLAHAERWNRADFVGNFAHFMHALGDGAADDGEAVLQLSLKIARATSAMIHQHNAVLELQREPTTATTP